MKLSMDCNAADCSNKVKENVSVSEVLKKRAIQIYFYMVSILFSRMYSITVTCLYRKACTLRLGLL